MSEMFECYQLAADNSTNATDFDETSYQYYYDDYYEAMPESYATAIYLMIDVSPIIVSVLSFFGNVTICVVFVMKKNRIFSTATFFISLAAADLLATLSGTFIPWLSSFTTSWNMALDCTLTAVVMSASKNISAASLVCITWERAISVHSPHKVRVICTPTLAKSLVTTLWILCFALHIFVGFHVKVVIDRGYMICEYDVEVLGKFFQNIFPYLNTFIAFVAPFVLICTGSIVIIRGLSVRSKHVNTPNKTPLKTITAVVIATNTVFIISKLPWFVFLVYSLIRQKQDPCWRLDINTDYVTSSSLYFIDTLDHGLNFFIYFLSGSQFRKDVKKLFISLIRKICPCCHGIAQVE